MAFVYTNTHGSYFVNVGLAVGTPTSPTFVSISDSLPYLEPVTRALTHTVWDLGWLPVEDTLGIYRDHGSAEVGKVLDTKPQNYLYDSHRDYLRYGSNLDSIRQAVAMLRGESISFLPGREHSVLHSAYRGDIGPSLEDSFIPGFVDSSWVEIVNSNYGAQTSRPCYFPNSYGNSSQNLFAANHIGGIDFTLDSYLPEWGYRVDVVTALEKLVSLSNNHGIYHISVFPWGTPYWTEITSLSYSVDSPTKITVRFTSSWSEYTVGPSWVWDCKLTLTRTIGLPAIDHRLTFVNDWWHGPIALTGTALIQSDCTLVDGHLVDYFTPGLSIGSHSSSAVAPPVGWVYQSNPVRGDGTGFDVPDFLSFSRRGILSRFVDEVQFRASDIRASSFLSASDALDVLSGQIDTNLVEAAAEIGEFAEILPQLKDVASSIVSLYGGDVVTTVKGLIDLVTGLRLQQKFAWDPDFDLILNVLPKMQSVAERIARLRNSGEMVARGTFHYEFPVGEFGRETSKLVTRSRVVCRRDSKSLLEDVLGVRALGILPDPSHVWAVIPFSFVIDWFIGVGGRIHDLENISFLTLMSVRAYTHSYLVTSPLTDIELARDGLKPSNISVESSTPELRFYAREVSAYVPRVYDGRYDFQLPGRLPNWMTAGSLAWQLMSPR